MPAGRKDFSIEKGATFSRVISLKNSDDTAVNLTGYTARMKIKAAYSSSSALVEMTTENGRITLGGTAGTITLLISATDTAALTANMELDKSVADPYVYDLELVNGSVVDRTLEGNVFVYEEATS